MSKKKVFQKSKVSHVELNPPYFPGYTQPNGWLDPCRACQGLWYYYLLARKAYEEHILNPIVLEGDEDPKHDFRQLWSSVAKLYQVQPEEMVHFWSNVDLQCTTLKMPKMPGGDQYRFDAVPEVRTIN